MARFETDPRRSVNGASPENPAPNSPARFAALPAPKVSFEFFPPRTEKMEQRLWQSIERLAPFQPEFVSVTYCAGGSTRERTHRTVCRIRSETELEPTAHLTCVNASRAEIRNIAEEYWDSGIRSLVALRGDPPDGKAFEPHPQGYRNAAELVADLKTVADFDISVAACNPMHSNYRSSASSTRVLRARLRSISSTWNPSCASVIVRRRRALMRRWYRASCR